MDPEIQIATWKTKARQPVLTGVSGHRARSFLGLDLPEAAPDHSTISRTSRSIAIERIPATQPP